MKILLYNNSPALASFGFVASPFITKGKPKTSPEFIFAIEFSPKDAEAFCKKLNHNFIQLTRVD